MKPMHTLALATLLTVSVTHASETPPPGACEVARDPAGIPALRAADDTGAFRCWGFLHGRDRAWQMDFLRRIAQGRRAELEGKDRLKSDFLMRILGFRERAGALLNDLPLETRQLLSSYAVGVNEGFKEALAKGVYEFKDHGYEPEEWTPVDTLSLIFLQSFDQTRKTFTNDMAEAKSIQDKPRDFKVEELLDPTGTPWDTSVLKKGEYAVALRPAASAPRPNPGADSSREALSALAELWPGPSPGAGSNNWVVAPSPSEGGKAWLANDPHLDLLHPPFWYWVHVESGARKAFGASVPGIPLVASGASEHLAWGLTNAYLDVADAVHVEEAELEEGTESFRPVLWFRFAGVRLPFFFEKFRRTRDGSPVIPLPAPEGKALVLRWSGFDIRGSDVASLLEMSRSETVEQMDKAIQGVGIPSWNIVFADTRGGIGYRVTGRIPRRAAPPALGVPAVKLAEAKFADYLTADEIPHLLRPKRGWIATANNRQWPKDAAFHGGRGYSEGFRAFRIEELLARRRTHDLESMRGIQCDTQAVDARFLLPPLLKLMGAPEEPKLKEAVELLSKWDYSAGLECKACALYRRWVDVILYGNLELDESALFHFMKRHAGSPGMRREFASALKIAIESLGPKMDRPWKEMHVNPFSHLMGAGYRPAEPIPTPGDTHSVNPGSANWDGKRFLQDSGASQRLVVQLTSPPRIHGVLAGPIDDMPEKKLGEPGGPWMKWAECRHEPIEFPVDWTKASGVRALSAK